MTTKRELEEIIEVYEEVLEAAYDKLVGGDPGAAEEIIFDALGFEKADDDRDKQGEE